MASQKRLKNTHVVCRKTLPTEQGHPQKMSEPKHTAASAYDGLYVIERVSKRRDI